MRNIVFFPLVLFVLVTLNEIRKELTRVADVLEAQAPAATSTPEEQ